MLCRAAHAFGAAGASHWLMMALVFEGLQHRGGVSPPHGHPAIRKPHLGVEKGGDSRSHKAGFPSHHHYMSDPRIAELNRNPAATFMVADAVNPILDRYSPGGFSIRLSFKSRTPSGYEPWRSIMAASASTKALLSQAPRTLIREGCPRYSSAGVTGLTYSPSVRILASAEADVPLSSWVVLFAFCETLSSVFSQSRDRSSAGSRNPPQHTHFGRRCRSHGLVLLHGPAIGTRNDLAVEVQRREP